MAKCIDNKIKSCVRYSVQFSRSLIKKNPHTSIPPMVVSTEFTVLFLIICYHVYNLELFTFVTVQIILTTFFVSLKIFFQSAIK